MTKQFDPHKPFMTRDGRKRKLIAVLDTPAINGETIITQDLESHEVDHYQPDGSYLSGRESVLDLVNIPETVTVEAWAVVRSSDGYINDVFYDKEEDAIRGLPSDMWRAVRLTGSYER